jgi:tetratricopeptide (TPR) repeat protein
MLNKKKLMLLLCAGAVTLTGAACTGGKGGGGGDKTPEVIKETQRQKMAKTLGLETSAIDKFEEATTILGGEAPDLVKAEKLLEESVKASPDFLEASYNLGVVQEKRGRYKEAISTYQKAMDQDKLNTHTVKLLLAIGRAQALDGQGEAAVKTFEEVLRLDPENLDVLNSLASAYLTSGRLDDALDHVKRVLKEENENLTALNTLAQIYTEQDNRSMAVYVFKKAARVALGGILSDEDLATEPAVLVLTERYKKEAAKQDLAADLLNNLGLIYIKMDKLPLAVINFKAAGELDKADVESRLNIGAIYLRYLDYDSAEAQFEAALKTEPSNCTGILGLAASHYAKGADAAADGYQRYLQDCDEKDTSSYLQLERIYERKQDFENAIKYCELFVKNGGKDESVNSDYCKALANMATMARDQPMAPEGGELPPEEGMEEMPPEDGMEEMPPEEGMEEMAPEGGEAAPEGEQMAPEGGEAAPEGEEMAPEGGEAAPQ